MTLPDPRLPAVGRAPAVPAGCAAPLASLGAGTPSLPALPVAGKDGTRSPVLPPPPGGGAGQGPGSGYESARVTGSGQAPAGRANAVGKPRRPAGHHQKDGKAAVAAAMSERELEEHIRELCRGLGVLRFHVRDSRGMNRGMPDDVLIGAGGILWRECKTQKGRLTPEQQDTGEALAALGQDYALWRPADLLSGRIARELEIISGRAAGAA